MKIPMLSHTHRIRVEKRKRLRTWDESPSTAIVMLCALAAFAGFWLAGFLAIRLFAFFTR